MSIKRGNQPKLIDFTITRGVIPMYSIETRYMLNKNTGYIKISRFAETTADEFFKALTTLKQQGATQMIIDVRGNSGGMLESVISMADELLDKNKLIVYTEGRNRPRRSAYAKKAGVFEQGKIAILIDEFSASASEILAGAIQDNDRGIVVGRKSFGKGLVQEQMSLPDGSAIRLTVARYYTPSGRSIQRPYDKGVESYYNDFYDEMLDKHETKKTADTTKYKTLKGRIVYGGGGITPDYIIPHEKANRYIFYNQLFEKGLIYQFAFDLAEKEKNIKQKYATANDFMNLYNISDAVYNQFIMLVKQNKLEVSAQDISANKSDICKQFKALIGRQHYGEDVYYKILNTDDRVILKALQEIK